MLDPNPPASQRAGSSIVMVNRRAAVVMAGLDPAIPVLSAAKEDVDGRDKRGHDDCWSLRRSLNRSGRFGRRARA
jgi:hypothetical protein